eukprot:2289172-Amphidinium_carterae.2
MRVIVQMTHLFDEHLPQGLHHHTGATRELLPLPVVDAGEPTLERLIEWRGDRDRHLPSCRVRLADSWLLLVVRTLNAQVKTTAGWWRPRAVQKEALLCLWEACYDFGAEEIEIPDEDWRSYLAHHRVDYHGEVALVAQELSWERVEAALPPEDCCAILDAEQVCRGSALSYLQHPEEALCEDPSAHVQKWKAKVHVRGSERVLFARELLERGLVTIVRPHELVRIHGQPILNGLFGIEKGSEKVCDRHRGLS